MNTQLHWGKITIFALLGVGLVLNPLYLYPNGTSNQKTTYVVTEISDNSTATQALQQDHRILSCPVERPCALEERIHEEGAVRYNGSIQRNQSYPVIQIDGDMYLPKNEVENHTSQLSLNEVSPLTAAEHAAIPVSELQHAVRTAAETGSVTVYGDQIEAFERNWIFESDGRFYWNSGFRSSGTYVGNSFVLYVLRSVMFVLGVGLVFYAGWAAQATFNRPS